MQNGSQTFTGRAQAKVPARLARWPHEPHGSGADAGIFLSAALNWLFGEISIVCYTTERGETALFGPEGVFPIPLLGNARTWCMMPRKGTKGGAGQTNSAAEVDERENLYEIVIWKVDRSTLYPEAVRYRLAFIRSGEQRPALLYDNHHPKGHHRHVGTYEEPYSFVTARQLVADFLAQATVLAGEVK